MLGELDRSTASLVALWRLGVSLFHTPLCENFLLAINTFATRTHDATWLSD